MLTVSDESLRGLAVAELHLLSFLEGQQLQMCHRHVAVFLTHTQHQARLAMEFVTCHMLCMPETLVLDYMGQEGSLPLLCM